MHLFKSSKITGNNGITAVFIDKMALSPENFNQKNSSKLCFGVRIQKRD